MLWFAHREDGFEAHSIATLTSLGIPVERLDPAESRDALAAGRAPTTWPSPPTSPRPGLLLRADRGVLADGRGVHRGGRPVRARRGPARRRGRRPPRRRRRPATATRFAGDTFVFAGRAVAAAALPRPPGRAHHASRSRTSCSSARPAATAGSRPSGCPAGSTTTRAFYGLPAIDGRGCKIAPDRYGPAFDPTDGDRLVDPDIGPPGPPLRSRAASPTWPTRRSSRPASASTRRRPTREFIIDRHPELRQRLDRRRRLGPRLQARPGHRQLPGVAHRGRTGRRRRGALLADRGRASAARTCGRAPTARRRLTAAASDVARAREVLAQVHRERRADRRRPGTSSASSAVGADPVDEQAVDDDRPDVASDDRAGHACRRSSPGQRDHRLALEDGLHRVEAGRAVQPAEDDVRPDRELHPRLVELHALLLRPARTGADDGEQVLALDGDRVHVRPGGRPRGSRTRPCGGGSAPGR